MEPTRCISSQLLSHVLTWRNPKTEDLSSLEREECESYYQRIMVTEVALLPLAFIASIEIIAYAILATITTHLRPFTEKSFNYQASRLASSTFTIDWILRLLWKNLFDTHLIEHESFALLQPEYLPRWDHLNYAFKITADHLMTSSTAKDSLTPEMKFLISRCSVINTNITSHPEFIRGTQPTGRAWETFQKYVKLVSSQQKEKVNQLDNLAQESDFLEVGARIELIENELKELGENADPVKKNQIINDLATINKYLETNLKDLADPVKKNKIINDLKAIGENLKDLRKESSAQ